MNINLKARMRNKSFWMYILSALAALSQLLGLKIFPENWSDFANIILGILITLGIIIDNSTSGLNDSIGDKEGVE